MPSVIEMYRLNLNKKNKKNEGDVLGLIRVLYPDIEQDSSVSEMLLKRAKGDNK